MASSCNTLNLKKYLHEIDDQNKILPTDDSSTRISQDIESIVQAIASEISNFDGRFSCVVIRSGSFYSGLKVGEANEFDFMFYLEYFSKTGLLTPTTSDVSKFFELLVTDEHVDELRHLVEKYKYSDSATELESQFYYKLDVRKFQDHYKSLLLNAIQSLEVQHNYPDGWHQSTYYSAFDHLSKNAVGVNNVSGISLGPSLLHGPSFNYEFEGSIEGLSKRVKVNIDMCPVFSLSGEQNILEKCGLHLKVDESSWTYTKIMKLLDQGKGLLLLPAHYQNGGFLLPVWKLSTVILEDAILSEFDHESIELKSLRILKVLRREHMKDETKAGHSYQSHTNITDSMTSESVATFTKSDDEARALGIIYQSFKSFTTALLKIHDDYKSYEEDKACLVSSYQLKLEWLKYMIFRLEKPALTDDDLVETVFNILKRFAKFVDDNERSKDVFFNIPVSTLQTEEDKISIITAINNLIQHLENHFL